MWIYMYTLVMDLCASVLVVISSWINYAPWWVLDILFVGTLLETCTGLYLCSCSQVSGTTVL